MEPLLCCRPEVAGKDWLYRTQDKMVALKPALEAHLTSRCQALFWATTEPLLYDLTST